MKNKFLILFSGFLFSLIGIVSAHIGDDNYSHHNWMMGSYYSGGFYGGIFMWIFMALIIVGLVLLIIYLIKKIQNEDKIARRSNKRK